MLGGSDTRDENGSIWVRHAEVMSAGCMILGKYMSTVSDIKDVFICFHDTNSTSLRQTGYENGCSSSGIRNLSFLQERTLLRLAK